MKKINRDTRLNILSGMLRELQKYEFQTGLQYGSAATVRDENFIPKINSELEWIHEMHDTILGKLVKISGELDENAISGELDENIGQEPRKSIIYSKKVTQEELNEMIKKYNSGEEVDFSRKDYSGLSFISKNLRGANFLSSNLSQADLSSANFSETNLQYANLSSANLYCTKLSAADCTCANFVKSNLERANLHYVKVFRSQLNSMVITFYQKRSLDIIEG
jgi:hypothetical protein